MFGTRFSLALGNGALSLPQTGRILVVGPNAGEDLSALPRQRVTVFTPIYTDHAHWHAQGYDTTSSFPTDDFAAALIFTPRAKPLALAWIAAASAATQNRLVVVDGQKTNGIDSLLKSLKNRSNILGNLSKSHGKIIWFDQANVNDWTATDTQLDSGFTTRPGVFSADGIDKGSAVLSAAMPADIKGRVADLGAGWGYLSHHILKRPGVTSLDLIEANRVALDCAKINVTDPRARFFWADATAFKPGAPYDVVISNPPFHTGRASDPDLGRAFIRAAAQMLNASGRFVMVANRHLPYENTLAQMFRNVENLGGSAGFKLLGATKPRRADR